MRRILPFSFIIFIFCLVFFVGLKPEKTFAQKHSPLIAATGGPIVLGASPIPTISISPDDNTWVTDSETTFVGKNANRAKDMVNWVLTYYRWSYDDHTLIDFWSSIRNVVFVILVLVILITAFLMIITGGQSITAIQFFRRFIIIIFLITLSYAMIRLLYQLIDVVIGFFIRNPDGNIISTSDLLNISFDYTGFQGWRRFGYQFDESAFISLLLTKVTAITYFVMAGILIVRKVILWFFITVSPIYPILFFYYPIRNTAKVWIGEFFRWLLYAPLFTLFLNGLVLLWRKDIGLLPFKFGTNQVVYPTAINILLGGPGQVLGFNNSINYTDTFIQYVVALIMLWIVIFLPFVLLRIFLDYLSTLSLNKDNALGYVNNALSYLSNREFLPGKSPSPATPKSPPPAFPTGVARPIPYETATAGLARAIPETRSYNVGSTVNQYSQTVYQTANLKTERTNMEALRMTNLSIPTLRDVARFETSSLTKGAPVHVETSRVKDILQKISNPANISTSSERMQFSEVRQKLIQEKLKGNPIATSILSAAENISTVNQPTTNITNQTTNQLNQTLTQTLEKLSNPSSISSATEKMQYQTIKEKLQLEKQKGNPVATSVLAMADNFTHNATQSKEKTIQEFHQTLQKLANASTIVSDKERDQVNKINNILKEETAKGNNVAATIVSAAGVAATVAARQVAKPAQAGLPAVNQVQTVSLEDYESVKKMWQENYRKVAVPQALDKPNRTREEWIQDDIKSIDQAISLLVSGDPQKVKQGMSIVSNILPFLLIGGFSQTEVIAYLKAKSEAAKTVLTQIKEETEKTEEETTTFVSRKATTQKTRTLQAEDQYSENSEENTSELSEVSKPTIVQNIYHTINFKVSPVNADVAQMANLSIPTIQEVANFDVKNVSSPSAIKDELTKVSEILANILNPENIKNEQQKKQFSAIKERLIEEKTKGNPIALTILSTAQATTQLPSAQMTQMMTGSKKLFEGLANPIHIQNATEKQQYVELKDTLIEQSRQGNTAATAILAIASNFLQMIEGNKEDTIHQLQIIFQKLANPSVISNPKEKQNYNDVREALMKLRAKANEVATAILILADQAAEETKKESPVVKLPETNQIQTVNLDDYEAVKKMWEDNYQKLAVPKSIEKQNRTREEWLQSDIDLITNAINDFISGDPAKIKEGTGIVSHILPFLLIGGFSQSEIVAYLKAKMEAAKTVLAMLLHDAQKKDEDDTLVDNKKKTDKQTQEMKAETPVNKNENSN